MSFRRKFWIDAQIQGILVGRIVVYWMAVVVYFGVGIAVSQYCDNPEWTFTEHWQAWLAVAGPWIPSTCLLLPLVIYDIIRTSHAFTGPIIRIRQQLAKLNQNPNCTPLVLRQDDYWQDLIGPVNSLQHQVISLHLAVQKQREQIESLRSEPRTVKEINSLDAESNADAALSGARIAQIDDTDSQDVQNSATIGAS